MAVRVREGLVRHMTAGRTGPRKRHSRRQTAWKRPPASAGRSGRDRCGSGQAASGRDWGQRAGDRAAVQLAVCGGAFVLLVAAKLLLPAQAAVLRQSLGEAMERNLDVGQVFSAVGRVVAGEENGAEQVWQAMFSPLDPALSGEAVPALSDGGTGIPDDRPSNTDGSLSTSDGSLSGPFEILSASETAHEADGSLSDGADASLSDGTAYTVQPGQSDFALDVLRQYRPGDGGTAGSQTAEPSGGQDGGQSDSPSGGQDTGSSGGQSDSPSGGQDNGSSDGQSDSPSGGQDGGSSGGQSDSSSDRAGVERSAGSDIPEDVNMEQAILNFNYRTPVFGTLTSAFGWRTDPIQGGKKFHHGVDLAVPSGTDILCFADGTVTAVGESTSYGKYCIVDHAGGCSTLYAHCSRITASAGAAVAMGEKLGEVGATGAATGPHLHFELHREGIYLNPIYYVAHS